MFDFFLGVGKGLALLGLFALALPIILLFPECSGFDSREAVVNSVKNAGSEFASGIADEISGDLEHAQGRKRINELRAAGKSGSFIYKSGAEDYYDAERDILLHRSGSSSRWSDIILQWWTSEPRSTPVENSRHSITPSVPTQTNRRTTTSAAPVVIDVDTYEGSLLDAMRAAGVMPPEGSEDEW